MYTRKRSFATLPALYTHWLGIQLKVCMRCLPLLPKCAVAKTCTKRWQRSAALAIIEMLTSAPGWQAANRAGRLTQPAADATTASVLEAAARRLVAEGAGPAGGTPCGSPALARAPPSPFEAYLDACCSLAEDALRRRECAAAAGLSPACAARKLRDAKWDASAGHARSGAAGQKRSIRRMVRRFSDSPGDSSPPGSRPQGHGEPRRRDDRQRGGGGVARRQPVADALEEDCVAIGALREGLEDDCKRIGALRRAFSPLLGALAVYGAADAHFAFHTCSLTCREQVLLL